MFVLLQQTHHFALMVLLLRVTESLILSNKFLHQVNRNLQFVRAFELILPTHFKESFKRKDSFENRRDFILCRNFAPCLRVSVKYSEIVSVKCVNLISLC